MKTPTDKAAALIIFFAVLSIYTGFVTNNYYWDGIYFAQTIENARSLDLSLLHPNHLFYNVFGYLLYHLALDLGIQTRALYVMQYANCFLGAACAVLLFRILRSFIETVSLALVLTLLFAFSATWWKFSTDAGAYIPSVLFLLISFYLILPDKKPRPLILAITHAAAMCFHQLAVFFFPVVVLGLYLQSAEPDHRKRILSIAKYAAAAFVFTFGAYCISFYLLNSSFDFVQMLTWQTSYSTENGFEFDIADCIKHTVRGEIKLFFEGRFNFIREIINPITGVLLTLLIGALIGLFTESVRLFRARRFRAADEDISDQRSILRLCITWIVVYLVFLFFWIPQNTFYRLFYFPAVIMVIGILLKRARLFEKSPRILPLFVAIVAISNFLFFIYPYSHVRKDTPLALTVELNKVWSQNTVVFYSELGTDNQLIKYFNPASTWVQIKEINSEKLETELQKLDGRSADFWIETSALKELKRDDRNAMWLQAHTNEQDRYRITDPAYDVSLVRIFP